MTAATTSIGLPTIARKEGRRRLAIILSLVLVLAAAGSALFLVRGVDSQLTDIANTYEVRRQARELILALVDAETGQRGYLLTQDRAYLEPYQAAINSLDSTYKALQELVKDNAAQTARVNALADGIARKRAELSITIQLVGDNKLAEAMELLRSDEGRKVMDGLRDFIRTFVADEDAKLVERNAAVGPTRQGLVLAILAALAGAATLTYVLFTRTQAQFSSLARVSNQLLSQNEELEQHVRARTAEAEEARAHAERERARVEALLQDTNHRIGNSLATVSSLLGLQLTRSTSDEVKRALEAAQSRVHAIASGHRRLRLGADLETTNAAEFLGAVVEDLESSHNGGGRVSFHPKFEALVIPARDATTLGIVLGELVTNALKHAFAEHRSGNIWARFSRNDDGVVVLCVEDDGHGLANPNGSSDGGLGSMIIRQLARQFGGMPTYAPRDGGGTVVTVTLPDLARRATDE